jgi:hypothetical protein
MRDGQSIEPSPSRPEPSARASRSRTVAGTRPIAPLQGKARAISRRARPVASRRGGSCRAPSARSRVRHVCACRRHAVPLRGISSSARAAAGTLPTRSRRRQSDTTRSGSTITPHLCSWQWSRTPGAQRIRCPNGNAQRNRLSPGLLHQQSSRHSQRIAPRRSCRWPTKAAARYSAPRSSRPRFSIWPLPSARLDDPLCPGPLPTSADPLRFLARARPGADLVDQRVDARGRV